MLVVMKRNIAFVGLGSIAQRHINNIVDLYGSEDLNIDVYRSGIHKDNGYIGKYINSINVNDLDSTKKYDAVFITNPTSLHYNTLLNFINSSDYFFIEKPIFDNYELDITKIKKFNKIIYVACPLRYSKIISYLKNNIDFSKVISMRVICSSYLPDWRINVDYRKTYSAKREYGGGVELDLIHEWDYITYLMGFPLNVHFLNKKVSNLEINSNDIGVYIAEYNNCIVELHIDYFSRKNMRKIEIFTNEDFIECDILNSNINFNNKNLYFHEERNDYQKLELEYFFSLVYKHEKKSINDIDYAFKLLKLCKGGII